MKQVIEYILMEKLRLNPNDKLDSTDLVYEIFYLVNEHYVHFVDYYTNGWLPKNILYKNHYYIDRIEFIIEQNDIDKSNIYLYYYGSGPDNKEIEDDIKIKFIELDKYVEEEYLEQIIENIKKEYNITENKKPTYTYSVVLNNKKIIEGNILQISDIKKELSSYNKRDIVYLEILNPDNKDFILYPVMCGGDKNWYYKLHSERKNITDKELDREQMHFMDINKLIEDLKL